MNIPIKSSCLLIVLPLILYSCFTPRHVDHWVETHYTPIPSPKIKTKDKEYISITPVITQKETPYSKTIKGKDKLIPAFFYWKWKKDRICTLDRSIPVSNFTTSVLGYATTKGLREKLKGDKLELTIEQFPNVFSAKDEGWMVYVILWYIGKESVYIEPENKDLVVSYRILKDGGEVKKGSIILVDRNNAVSGKLFQSTEKMTWKYLDAYDNNIKTMGKQFVDQLLTELDN